MNRLRKCLWGLLLSLTAAQPRPDARGYIVQVGDPCPDVTLQLLDGNILRTKELRGQVVLLQFTASWCSVCRKEMPHLEREIWQPYRDKGLVMVGVDRDEPADTVAAFAREMGITYPLALDPGAEIFSRFAALESGVTRNVLIDRDGKIVCLTRLFDPDEFARLVRKVDELLQE
ncbi:MAG: TlpA family protein disulfide reductase [Candidatus Neomarinimicrobiota bacterium]|nr:MAG: TlpA family protein disulfide reductase [Candidatus Neomarinimicrobiota bacterium]